jgi:hypothetical protein
MDALRTQSFVRSFLSNLQLSRCQATHPRRAPVDARKFIRSLLRLAEALAFQRAWRIQPEDLRILEVPDRSDASRYHRRRVKKKNKRTREQLPLLVSSALEAEAVAKLAEQERRRVAVARADHRDRAAVLALADRERQSIWL